MPFQDFIWKITALYYILWIYRLLRNSETNNMSAFALSHLLKKGPYLAKAETNFSMSWQVSDWAWHKSDAALLLISSTQIGCKSMCRCYSNGAQPWKLPCWATSHWKAQHEHASPCFTGSEQKCPTAQRPVCRVLLLVQYCLCLKWSYNLDLQHWNNMSDKQQTHMWTLLKY